MELQCYKYNDLVQFGAAEQAGAVSSSNKQQMGPHIDWDFMIGEDTLDIIDYYNTLINAL